MKVILTVHTGLTRGVKRSYLITRSLYFMRFPGRDIFEN